MTEIKKRRLSTSDGVQLHLLEAGGLAENCDELVGANADSFAADFVKGMFPPQIPTEDLAFIVAENLKMPRLGASQLLQAWEP